MKNETEIALINELLNLQSDRKAFLDEVVTHSEVNQYLDQHRFDHERSQIFRSLCQPIAHSSELASSGDFIRRELAGLPLLLTRDDQGKANCFINVCRHRGTRLVDEHSGCKKRFSCPYHAWTWNNAGKLVGVPHESQGFPNLDRESYGLKRLGLVERFGWIWVNPAGEQAPNIDAHLNELVDDFDWLQGDDLTLLHAENMQYSANWKLLAEGGLEAYHFRVAHRNTIGPYFLDNLSTYQVFGNHIRSILAKKSITHLKSTSQTQWRVRDHAQVLYTLLPTSALLVQSDHISWIHFDPQAPDLTNIRISTLVPSNRIGSEEDRLHWQKNHDITVATLKEDFDIGVSIQSGLNSGANDRLTFGRFEGALEKYNQIVENALNK